ncbi:MULTISPECIES: acyltransferase [unclassified Novosphingobium]|uniref:acyltransferase family protein n=1 Tax=unclassified Novosphingobium TaxID=2644732 RepID=UPI00145A4D17|nr:MULTISPECIES: acyltransferase [unclassified Novosphingobium]MBB3356348.1 peptidoglycan/LPS O-acetylase OafA/YrhL [Novosphingobium sp. BK256]MBB3372749.1 peptidoglycan/LPS O-acetylase OafA/YrhL [Novosphingobium sp. BK280]MBB3377117.1 peptidoglycan/LPS O-acetylase OafA/YrhL [Novosphingobium sp. BK258]MBB3419472.1 peptidoglycan/LPS O-acetylase OafA/YrhL [Novosphingobium sp. BK267]MBB3448711.1 peptidoglycan/LPS O-acetylase OafA/YrhL [Novosphingobium sp. BK352]
MTDGARAGATDLGESQHVTQRFGLLDALRGVAALVVLAYHLVQQHSLSALPHAGLAVDFFYTLSGFVIAFAYHAQVRDGRLSRAGFARARARRLYPLLALGTVMGFSVFLGAVFLRHSVSLRDALLALGFALALLPCPLFPQWPTAFPLNMAAWSLAFEAYVNMAYALIARFLSQQVLLGLIGLGAVLVVTDIAHFGRLMGGTDKADFAFGAARVVYPFFTGILIFRWRRSPTRQHPLLALMLCAALAAALLIAPERGVGLDPALYDGALALLGFPLLVWLASAVPLDKRMAQAAHWLGLLSYPIYILQGPVLRLGVELARHAPLPAPALAWAQAVAVIAVAWAATRWFDAPVQAWLRRAERRRHAKATPANQAQPPFPPALRSSRS